MKKWTALLFALLLLAQPSTSPGQGGESGAGADIATLQDGTNLCSANQVVIRNSSDAGFSCGSAGAGDILTVGDCTNGNCFSDPGGTGTMLIYEGSIVNTTETILQFSGDPGTGADKVVTIPNTTGTIVTTGDADTITSAMIAPDQIFESDLRAVNAPADEQCLSYESTGGDFEWQACGGGGGGGDNIRVEDVDNSGSVISLTDADFDDSGDINFVQNTSITPNQISAQIRADAVGPTEIATDAVGPTEIAADAVGPTEIATDAVGSLEIATGAVGT